MRALFSALIIGLLALPVSAQMTLDRGTASDPDTLDPHKSLGNSAAPLLYDLFMGLMTVDGAGKPVFGSAESYEASDDYMTYTFTLKEGLKWSDGTPLTANDFVYSFRRLMKPDTAARYATWYYTIENAAAINRGGAPERILGVSAPDDRTLVFKLAQPYPIFPETLFGTASNPVPQHVIEEHGDRWTRPENFVSNGAYVLTERVPQTRVKLEKNQNFIEADTVQIDTVTYYPYQDFNTALKRFRAQDLDIILNFPPDQIEWIRENLPDELHISPTLRLAYFLFNTRVAPLDDPKVRQALSMMIDREALLEKLFPTGSTPAYSMVNPSISNYTPQQVDWVEMPMNERRQRAMELMREAGYDKDNPATLRLQFNSRSEEARKLVVAMNAMWRPLGIKFDLVNVDFRGLIRAARTKDFDVLEYFWVSPFDDASTFLDLNMTGNINNHTGFNDAEYDSLMERARAAVDMTERRELMQQAEKRLMDSHVLLPAFHPSNRVLVHQHVKGWIDNPRGANLARYLWIEPTS